MLKKLFFLLSLILCWQITSIDALAIYDPLLVPNNRFGIHILDINDVKAAAELVNRSNDREAGWGYVTLVIQDSDRDSRKWSDVFGELRLLHIIPVVRLATHGEDVNVWAKPRAEDISSWVDFLDSLPWPTKNRYVILFNEPNQAREWGGALAPDEYASIAAKFTDSLHEKNEQFFVLPAGFDVHADGLGGTMEVTKYWQLMGREVPGIFAKFDGWTSHAYPRNFTASPYQGGRYSIKSYLWELNYLANIVGIRDNLPVFITETGWSRTKTLSAEKIAEFYRIAFSSIWVEDNVVAVTPFLLNYQQPPFASFSWKKADGSGFFPQYEIIKGLTKILGEPLKVPFSRFGELLVREREEKLAKRLQSQALRYSTP